MAFSNIELVDESNTNGGIVLPLGFSWVMLFSPLLVGVALVLVNYAVYSAFGLAELAELEYSSLLTKVVVVLLFAVSSLILCLCFCGVPFFRKDVKWTVVALVAGVLTAGLSVIVLSFVYNKLFIAEKVGQGLKVSCLLGTDNDRRGLLELNPVEYSETYKKYFVWVDCFGLKFMRYFSGVDDAISFVASNPHHCLKINHISKSVRSLSDIDGGLKERYELPIQQWLLEAGARNKEYLQS